MAQIVRFLTDPYVLSHQKQPRGRGTWEFMAYAGASELGHSITTPSLTFTEARRCAETVARNAYPKATEIFVEVLP